MNYVTLRVKRGYYTPDNYYRDKFCIQGQRRNDLNWENIQWGFSTEEKAIEKMIKMNEIAFFNELPMYNSGGYGVN